MFIYDFLDISFKLFWINVLLFGAFFVLTQWVYWKLLWRKKKIINKAKIITFVHPFCADCGGGEKVLWKMMESWIVYSKPKNIPSIKVNIIAGVDTDAQSIMSRWKERFNIDFSMLKSNGFVIEIEIVRVKSAFMLKPQPFATMILQILGQILFAFEVISKWYSDVYVDTTGYPFMYPILKIFGHAKVTAYTHYPFISYDMISDVEKGANKIHSRGTFSKYNIWKQVKLVYYKMIMRFYKWSGWFVHYAQCNSSWTFNHMNQIWTSTPLAKWYPPCSTNLYEECSWNNQRQNTIVSFAQYRPEKNHQMQIRIMKTLVSMNKFPNWQMHIIGAVRNEEDQQYYNGLQNMVIDWGLQNHVRLIKNADFNEVKREFANAKIGIHTMKDEHFGISIIEMLAAGLIVIAHNSAGAKNDIIGPSHLFIGVWVENEGDYVESICNFLIRYDDLVDVKVNALAAARRFSDEAFITQFHRFVGEML